MAQTQTAQAIYSWTQNQLQPAYFDRAARLLNVGLAPGIYARGQVLGQITSANVNDVQTITINTVTPPTHAAITLTGLPGGFSYTSPAITSPALLTTALNALLGASSVAVTGTYADGAGGTFIITWGGAFAGQPVALLGVSAVFTGGTSNSIAIAHSTPGVGPQFTFAAYASGNSDGSQLPKGLLRYSCTVNNLGQVAVSTEWPSQNLNQYYASMYRSGAFRTEDLVGLDATALTNMPQALLVIGTVTQGLLEFGAA